MCQVLQYPVPSSLLNSSTKVVKREWFGGVEKPGSGHALEGFDSLLLLVGGQGGHGGRRAVMFVVLSRCPRQLSLGGCAGGEQRMG